MSDVSGQATRRTAYNLGLKWGRGHRIGRTKGGMSAKLHAVSDALGRPVRMFLTAGQRSDDIGARAFPDGLAPAQHWLADRVHDAEQYREELEDRGIPSRTGHRVPIPLDEERYRTGHKIETSFARLKDWRRIARRHDGGGYIINAH